jgi:hypothetical protein
MTQALIGVIGGLILVLVGLLITLTLGHGTKIDLIKEALTLKVDCEDYKEDKKVIFLKLENYGKKILRLQIFAKVVDVYEND